MTEYEELRADIDRYLMERFKYRKSLVRLTIDNVITTRRNSRIEMYLRIRKFESLFPPDCLVIARLGFSKERIGHGTHSEIFGSRVICIGIEYANDKSGAFAKKLGFNSIDGENYFMTVDNLKSYFSIE